MNLVITFVRASLAIEYMMTALKHMLSLVLRVLILCVYDVKFNLFSGRLDVLVGTEHGILLVV